MNILCRIRELNLAMCEYADRFERRSGLTVNEGMLLCSLADRSPLTPREIAMGMGLSGPNTSKLLSAAEKKGLVRRELCQKDRRQMYFSLTADGLTKLGQIRPDEIELPDILRKALNA